MTKAIARSIEAWPLAARDAGIFGHSPNSWRVVVTAEGREAAAAEAMLLELRSLIDDPVEHVAVHTAQDLIQAIGRAPSGVNLPKNGAPSTCADLVSCARVRPSWWSRPPTSRSWFLRRQSSGAGLVASYGIFNSRLSRSMNEPPEDGQEKRLRELRVGLQQRLLESTPAFADKIKVEEVWRSIKRCLFEAHGDECLETAPAEIHQYVPRPKKDDGNRFTIAGGLIDGNKPFDRAPELARLNRPDGAWLHFTLTLQCDKQSRVEELWAYDFELVFPEGHSPAFVRFDLNQPDHPNAAREIRSHMHPANDDLQLPAPVMNPEELLDVLLRRLKNQRDPNRPRS